MGFRFIERNKINTSASMRLSSGSTTGDNLFDRKAATKWVSSGEATDGDTATMSVVFGSSTIVSMLLLKNINFASFNVIYNSTTSSQFSPALSVTGWVNSNLYYSFASQAVNSIDVNIWSTQIAGTEKACGEFIVSNEKINLAANPSAQNYSPIKYKKGAEMEMIDGGMVSIFIAQKFRASINLELIPSATYSSLTAIYNEQRDFVFVPFPEATYTTAWNGESWPVIWTGDLDIERFRNNSISNGYRGTINLAQIPD